MPSTQARIVELASAINTRTNEINDYLKSSGIEAPSFNVEAAPGIPLPGALGPARDEILTSCAELQELVEGPAGYLGRITSPVSNILASLHGIYAFKIVNMFALNEQISYEDLAERCNASVDDIRRLVRMAICHHIFYEPQKGIIAHSAVSKLMVQNPKWLEWIGVVCEDMWPAASKTIPAMLRWPGSQEPHETAYGLTQPEGKSYWDTLKNDTRRTQRFAMGMELLQSLPPFDVNYLIQSLGWGTDDVPSLLVDVGGSQGSIAVALLRKYPTLKCCVQDLPEAIEGAVIPKDVEGRLEYMEHNMFTEQPVKNAEVYLLRSILHDWSDKYALQIIRNLVPAMRQGTRVIVNESCLPEPNQVHHYHERIVRGYDIAMQQSFNSKERDAEEWADLFKRADPRFKLNRISAFPGSFLAVIELAWESD